MTFRILIVAACLAVIICGIFAKSTTLNIGTRCTTTYLNVRSRPTTSSKILRILRPNTRVNVISKPNNSWAMIGNGQYVYAPYLKICAAYVRAPVRAPARSPVRVPSKPSYLGTRCTTTYLNVRSQPNTSSKVLRTLPPYTRVNVISKPNNSWAMIGNGQYVFASYLSMCSAPGTSSGGITQQQLQTIMPNLSSSKARLYLPALNQAMSQGGINNCPRKAAFLAQLAHESGELRYWVELSSGSQYNGRRDLGNIYPGDGERYKGRGPIQLTGRANYRAAGEALGLPLEQDPAMVSQVNVGFRTSIWFWNSRGLSQIADANTQAAFNLITLRINGGYNGLADRDMYWRRAKAVLGC